MRTLLFAALLAMAVAAPAAQEDVPPEGAKRLSKIVEKVEKNKNVAYVTEAKYEDGVYKVRYRSKDGKNKKAQYDAKTGERRKNKDKD